MPGTVVLDGDLTDARNGTRCDGAHQMGYRAEVLGQILLGVPVYRQNRCTH